jgi:hypothetical protein
MFLPNFCIFVLFGCRFEVQRKKTNFNIEIYYYFCLINISSWFLNFFLKKANLMEEENPNLETQDGVFPKDET